MSTWNKGKIFPCASAGVCMILLVAGTVDASATSGGYSGLSVSSSGVLELNGSPYSGIGVDMVQPALTDLLANDPAPVKQDFQELQAYHIPFVRFPALAAWGSEASQYSYLSNAYMNDPTQYFNAMNELCAIANQYNVGLIPSLAFSNWPNSLAEGEASSSAAYAAAQGLAPWTNPTSPVDQIWTQYVTQMVTRYEHNPAIWGWEFGNELNLQMDLPNAASLFPGYQPSWDYTHAQMWNVYQQFVGLVRQYDPYHIIEAGNSFPTSSSYHNMVDGTWTTDTPAQWAYMLKMDNSPFDMISGHAYGSTALEDINAAVAVSQQEHKPLFVGEFGVPGTKAESQALFQEMLNTLVADKVPLAAVWAFDETGQTAAAGEASYYSITPTNGRSFMLAEIEAANAADGNPVPEPATLGLFGLGGALALLLPKRRRKGQSPALGCNNDPLELGETSTGSGA